MADAYIARTQRACKDFSHNHTTDFGPRGWGNLQPGGGTAFPYEPVVLQDDEIRALVDELAKSVVDGSVAAAQRPEEDPLLRDLSPIASLSRSLVIRSGQLIPDIIAAVLQKAGYETLREYRLPLTKTAAKLIAANRFVGKVILPTDDSLVDHLDCDLIVIDCLTRNATILECMRGTTPLSSPRTKGLVRRVRTAALSARAALTEDGIHVGVVTGGVFDRYGKGGYDEDVTICGKRIDAFFGADIFEALEAFDQAVYARLVEVIPTVLRPLLRSVVKQEKPAESSIDDASERSSEAAEEREQNPNALWTITEMVMPTDVGKLVSPLAQRELYRSRDRGFSDSTRRTH